MDKKGLGLGESGGSRGRQPPGRERSDRSGGWGLVGVGGWGWDELIKGGARYGARDNIINYLVVCFIISF